MGKKVSSPTVILLACVAAAITIGLIVNLVVDADVKQESWFKNLHKLILLPGKIWIRAMKLIVLPLIFSNIILSVYDIKKQAAGSKLAVFTILYCLTTTICAVTIGLIMASIILLPNVKELDYTLDPDNLPSGGPDGVVDQIVLIFYGIIPQNVVKAMYAPNLIGCIFVAAVLGSLIKNTPEAPSFVLKLSQEVNDMMFKCINVLVLLTGPGVFCILYTTFATQQSLSDLFSNAAILVATIVCGLALQVFVVYPSLYFLFHRALPVKYYMNMGAAVLMAMGCASSAATLPVTLRCCTKNGVRESVSKFVCSLGATVNMDGTAVNFPCSVIFLAAAQGQSLTFGNMLMIAVVATLASVGTAPIPSAGLVLLLNIMNSVGVMETTLFSIIIAIDPFTDRLRTMTNVLGDSVAAACVNSKYGHVFDDAAVASTEEGEVTKEQPDDVAAVAQDMQYFDGGIPPAPAPYFVNTVPPQTTPVSQGVPQNYPYQA